LAREEHEVGAAMVGTRRTESGSFSLVIVSKNIVETLNLLNKAVEDPRQMSSAWSGKLLAKLSVKNNF